MVNPTTPVPPSSVPAPPVSPFPVPPSPPRYPSLPVQAAPQDTGLDLGYLLLGFFIPLVGFLLWLTTKDTQPQKAQSALKGTLGGIAITGAVAVFTMMALTFMGARLQNTFGQAANSVNVTTPTTSTSSPTNSTTSTTSTDSTSFFASEREQLEQELPAQISSELLTQRGITIPCTRLVLVESFAHNYTGIAYFEDGSSAPLTVVVGDGGIVWKFD